MPRTTVILTLMIVGCLTSGCASPATTRGIDSARQAFQAKQYSRALELAGPMAGGKSPLAYEAAYIAGSSAYQLNRLDAAERYLVHAAKSKDRSLAGDALSTLGLLYNRQQRYELASEALLSGAKLMTGEDRANAYFYAAIAQQKLGWWPRARETLLLARQSSKDPAFHRRVEAYLNATGFTLQFGAYGDIGRARRHQQQLTRMSEAQAYGQPRVVSGTDDRSTLVYRVHLGRFSSHATAARARQRIGVSDAIIVPLAEN